MVVEIQNFISKEKFNEWYGEAISPREIVMASFHSKKNSVGICLPNIWTETEDVEKFIQHYCKSAEHESLHAAIMDNHNEIKNKLYLPVTYNELIVRRVLGEKSELNLIPYILEDMSIMVKIEKIMAHIEVTGLRISLLAIYVNLLAVSLKFWKIDTWMVVVNLLSATFIVAATLFRMFHKKKKYESVPKQGG